jgi:hypothetical protein
VQESTGGNSGFGWNESRRAGGGSGERRAARPNGAARAVERFAALLAGPSTAGAGLTEARGSCRIPPESTAWGFSPAEVKTCVLMIQGPNK